MNKSKLILFLSLWFGLSFPGISQNPPKNKPNILIILTDDQGYHDVSYYGTEDLQTPNIDALRKFLIYFPEFISVLFIQICSVSYK